MLETCQEDLGPRLQGLPLTKHETSGELSHNKNNERPRAEKGERKKLKQMWQNFNIWEICLKGTWEFLVLFLKFFYKPIIISKEKVKIKYMQKQL